MSVASRAARVSSDRWSWRAGAVALLGRHAVVGPAALLACLVYVSFWVTSGWIPHDEGQLGQTAERILQGELPHRDFVDPYTGGLGFLSALAMRIGGVRAESIRWMTLPFLAGFLACCYWIASRWARPALAAAVTFLCAAMTLPVYAAAMPSWYNLFFATYAVAALCRHLDTGHRRWLIVAGAFGGCSILFKITGLYCVAAGLLFIAYREQLLCDPRQPRSLLASWLATGLLGLFGALAFFFIRRDDVLMDVVHFVLPYLALTSFVIWHEWRAGRGRPGERARRVGQLAGSLLAGVLLVVVPYVVLFVKAGALWPLVRGVFVLPFKRFEFSTWPLPSWETFLLALPVAVLLLWGLSGRTSRLCPGLLAGGLVLLLAFSHLDPVYRLTLQALRNLLPVIVMAGVATLWWGTRGDRLNTRQRQELLLLSGTTLLVSLVQYPHAVAYYCFFAAPLGVLAALDIALAQPAAPRRALLCLLGFLMAFLVLRLHRPGPTFAGDRYRPEIARCRLGLERCNLLVRRDQAELYRAVIQAVQDHSPPGSYIYAAVDAPEIYFLASRRNPTPTLYDFFDDQDAAATRRIVQMLDRRQIPVVVIKRFSEFSDDVSGPLLAAIEARFPHKRRFWMATRFGRIERFRVYWRDAAPPQARRET